VPALGTYSDSILLKPLWQRPDLLKRDCSIATLSAIIAATTLWNWVPTCTTALKRRF
jgi:hypothetical protein